MHEGPVAQPPTREMLSFTIGGWVGLCDTVDGAPSHLHPSVCKELKKHGGSLYISPPSCTPYTQACDKKEVNAAFGTTLEDKYADFVDEEVIGRKKRGPVPAPSRVLLGNWVADAFEAITDDKLRAACASAYFPRGLKLTQLEDEEYFNSSQPDPVPDSDSDSESDPGTDSEFDSDSDSDDESDSGSDSGSDSDSEQVDILWAKANRGIWGLAHVFENKLYLTRDLVDAEYVP